MNVGQMKAFLGEQSPAVSPDKAIKKQLQEEGLRQAAEFQQQQAAKVSVSSNQTTIGMKVLSQTLDNSIILDGKKNPDKSHKAEDAAEKNAQSSLFDFEKIAKNVMKFVGNVINGAAKSGASSEKLGELIGQAREGVAKGFAMAEKEIGGLMNDEIAEGIDRSRSLLADKLDELEKRLTGTEATNTANPVHGSQALGVGASEYKEGAILIRTKDGDELTLSFENLREFQYNQQSIISLGDKFTEGEDAGNTSSLSQIQRYSFYEKTGISFSLQGELDDEEMEAIADLVGQAHDLADTFFSGDLDKAFEQALKVGYNDEELAGFAMQLNHTQQTEVVQAYQNVRNYKEGGEGSLGNGNVINSIAKYMDKMMDLLNHADEKLESGNEYGALVNGLISQMEDVQVPDLVSAINRFNEFNKRLLNAMPTPVPDEANA
ncbi:DUF5610 domain-containing protein [Alteromonas sp. ASW11-130]|uniref:DUF5610 domain-containing protein n=1 Tax=Alteromonas sp. ASW11-130 TaxID=3015775 RepID=UPI00224285B3|nr:DUF5610 domain-containing protein [Alteromonas sp. ASW11-130]MCW8092704.1 DUF5610 domain-containing protein [Alteromonas sp. ASW11-130]